MQQTQHPTWPGIMIAAALFTAGCASTGSVQDQALGTGIGAALGCGVGVLITGDARGCATGAAVGAMVGFGAVAITQYNSRQVRSAASDSRTYGLSQAPATPQVKVRMGTSTPKEVARGGSVNLVTDYSVALPRGVTQASVSESWTLKKGGKVVQKLPAKSAQRTAGGWQADAVIKIPSNVPPGTYVIEHRVESGDSYDTDESTFVVQG